MPRRKVAARYLTDDIEIETLIEQAEKIIATHHRTPRVNNAIETISNTEQIQSIRNELDNFLAPTPPLLQSDDLQEQESSTVFEIIPVSSNPSTSTISNGDDDVLLVNDSNCSSIVVDLCTPPNNQNRRRRHYVNTNDNIIDLIEIDDYQPESKYTVTNARSPRKSLTQQNNIDFNRNLIMCPICLESTENRQPKSTKCGHVFCSNCIRNSLKVNKNCPICKRRCSEKQLITLFL